MSRDILHIICPFNKRVGATGRIKLYLKTMVYGRSARLAVAVKHAKVSCRYGFEFNSLTLKVTTRVTARTFAISIPRRDINKVWESAAKAVDDVPSGATILCGGFGLCGVPDSLINALRDRPEKKNLIAVSNNAGVDGGGLGQLLQTKQVSKMIASYVGENKTFERMYLSGEIELELTPQGTIAERCRAGGAGVPAFYTPTAFGTQVQTGELTTKYNADGTVKSTNRPREVREFNGKPYVMEEAIQGDFALIKAYKADTYGNLQFRLAAHNFNGAMARNAKVTIVEAEHIVEPGEIDPAAVHVPGIYVNRVVPATEPKGIEKYTFAKSKEDLLAGGDSVSVQKREKIVKRAAKEFKNGMYANLGIGMPMLAPNFLPEGIKVFLQSENGILGLGPYPEKGQEDADLINAGKETVTLAPGAALFGSEESFGMIRGGKVDMSILGGMQVSMYGDLANWVLPKKVLGMGGAMDLVANPDKTKVVITMEHTSRKGQPKILKQCTFPLTGTKCVKTIITDLAVFDVDRVKGLTLLEVAEGSSVDEVKQLTEAPFEISKDLKTF